MKRDILREIDDYFAEELRAAIVRTLKNSAPGINCDYWNYAYEGEPPANRNCPAEDDCSGPDKISLNFVVSGSCFPQTDNNLEAEAYQNELLLKKPLYKSFYEWYQTTQ